MSFRFEHNFQMTDSVDKQVDDRAGFTKKRNDWHNQPRYPNFMQFVFVHF